PCLVPVCNASSCAFGTLPAGTTCGDALECDGQGQCVGCTMDADCPAAECTAVSCDLGLCNITNEAPSTPCAGGVCDGTGLCVECASASDCPVPSDPCQVASCSGAACQETQAPEGTACG